MVIYEEHREEWLGLQETTNLWWASPIVLASPRWVTKRRLGEGIGLAAHTRYLKSWLDTPPESGSPRTSYALPAVNRDTYDG
jgi:hypothetical protein